MPFCSVSTDNALEHVNRSMKVSGRLVGITLNPTAHTKYFLIAPKLARLAQQAKQMAGTLLKTAMRHHNFGYASAQLQEQNIQQLVSTVRRFTDPFLEQSPDLFNLVIKVVMPEKVKKDIGDQSIFGKELCGKFAKERIQTSKCSIWVLMKKRKLLTWKTTGKKLQEAMTDKVVEFKEDRSLFAWMMVVCKSHQTLI